MPLIRTTKTISAPPQTVWRHLTHTSDYKEWNPLIHDFRGRFEEGCDVKFKIQLGSMRLPLDARVVRADGHELRWEGPASKTIGRLGHASHYFRLREQDGKTQFEHGEYFGGPVFELSFGLLKSQLDEAYNGFNDALAARCES